MAKIFQLRATISSDSPRAVRPVIIREIEGVRLSPLPDGFSVEADVKGENARDLNRGLLTALRKAEKRTRLRSEWTSGGITEKFFDYVPKSQRKEG